MQIDELKKVGEQNVKDVSDNTQKEFQKMEGQMQNLNGQLQRVLSDLAALTSSLSNTLTIYYEKTK